MSTSIKDQRNRFILKVAVLEIEKKYDVAEELIREARHFGIRKSGWVEAVVDFIKNRREFPDHQGWAIRQWIVAANYVNGSTINARINSAGDAGASEGQEHGRTEPEGDGQAREAGSSGGLHGRL